MSCIKIPQASIGTQLSFKVYVLNQEDTRSLQEMVLFTEKPNLMLYNIHLLINCYIGSIAINAMTKTMKNIWISHGYFIRSLGHCSSP